MKVNFTETVLRDANQSLIATRMPFDDFAGILQTMDEAGYYSIECWGGATFDSCLRFLNEDPWERLRKIKSVVKNTKLQMLLRGANLLGYKHYPDDVVRRFTRASVENGVDIIRIFDALNDVRNIEICVDETIKAGGLASGCIAYTLSPIHTLESYIKLTKQMVDMGVGSVCIKDMAGIMSPKEAYDLVRAIKENCDIPVVLHTHSTTGYGPMTLLKAVEAGCDVIDTAIASFSGGTSQPCTETMYHSLKQFNYDTGLNSKKLKEINDFFKPLKAKYLESGLLDPYVMGTDTDCLEYQVPGGMLSNLVSQLKQANSIDKLPLVLEETPKVREELGFPPLVTPMSQMVGVQAATNVLVGERYKNVSKEIAAYVRGEYGHPPGEIDPALIKKILGDDKPVTGRYAATLAPEFEKAKAKLGDTAHSDEDVLSYIVFPQITEKYFEKRDELASRKVKYSITKE